MYNILYLTILLSSIFFPISLTSSTKNNGFQKFENLQLNEKSYQIIHKLHINWYLISVKSLLAQLGKEVYNDLDNVGKKIFINCLDNINNEGDLTESAQCLIDGKKRLDKYKKMKLNFINYQKGFYRRRFARSPYRLIDKSITSSEYTPKVKPIKIKKMSSYNLLDKREKSPVARVSDLILKFVKKNQTSDSKKQFKWKNTLKKIQNVKKIMDEQKKLPGAKPYTLRMYDLVLENDEPTESPKEKKSFVSRAKSLLSLFFKLSGDENEEKREESNVRWLSPRIAPVMPDKAKAVNQKSFLSPDILSLYEEDNEITDKNNHQQENSLINVPKLLSNTGMSNHDKDKFIEMLMEVSGATKSFEEANSILKALHFFETKNEIMDANERVINSFNKLNNSLNFYQQNDMKKKGFTFIEVDQLDRLLQDQGVKNDSKMYEELNYYRNMNRNDRELSLWMKIEEIAKNGSMFYGNMRFKRTLPVNVLKPTVLSPYMFTPILGLTVLGPTILSPSLFSPLILNPAVLSPYILSPAIGMPFILSPYLLSPYILSPIIMAPFILNPYVLSPNILNPYVLSPLILSPLVLCPDILSPQVLGGAILSPSVLSPAVATESALMANVLSPTFLS
ncbi:Moulting cycle MLT-10-like protein family-containing protein [Strongyloides ratti]|uniref:Moulting cycle MLT-10-like protein family-containing protein n=1 Tax=Strongyloides ratti TaxID=34506 RepID=A0A090MU24_STRRB|nr:Moulting cycle MLT-10-like protein family-containing protein [Strongyloides ratti]CEF61938.1 Moulting cycle MLT-10-like protein family-containing protein [Strongyloides ratti]